MTSAVMTTGDVTDNDGIKSVWMVIRPPCYSYGASQNLITEALLSPVSQGAKTYTGSYSEFTTNGDYIVTVYAKDKRGFYCTSPVDVTVSKTGGNDCGTKGDFDEDDLVTLADAIIALKVLTGTDTNGLIPENYAGSGIDVDEDFKAGLSEVIYILQDIAKIR